MEESISLPELLITSDALFRQEHRLARIVFGSQGHNIDEDVEEKPKTAEDVYIEAMNEIHGYDVELAEIGIVFDDKL